MAALTRRVNLRLEEDTYLAFEKVALFFNRSVADLLREAADNSVPTMDALGEMIDRAKAGDEEASKRLFSKLLDSYSSQIDLAREVEVPEDKGEGHAEAEVS